ncbi:GREB1 isoform X1 [Brachionus plicatilis]|uniref:GREB1 isoform X1 n=1 Tax=Brachionus plicatilis TaxID=10195 RepID=A0A3M7RU18_BRAPC|nr:GREB1 isoform X1 [Brachionus plicatilis]
MPKSKSNKFLDEFYNSKKQKLDKAKQLIDTECTESEESEIEVLDIEDSSETATSVSDDSDLEASEIEESDSSELISESDLNENNESESEESESEESDDDSDQNERDDCNDTVQGSREVRMNIPITLICPISSFFKNNHEFYNKDTWSFSWANFNEKKIKDCILMHEYFFFDKSLSQNKKNIFIQKLILYIINLNNDNTKVFPWINLFNKSDAIQKKCRDNLAKEIENVSCNKMKIISELKKVITKTMPALVQSIKSNKKEINFTVYARKNSKPITFILLRVQRNLAPSLNGQNAFIEIVKMLNHDYNSIPKKKFRLEFSKTTVKKTIKLEGKKKISPNYYGEEEDILEKNFIFEPQKQVGQVIFETIRGKISKLDKYTKFKFYLIVPPRLSLRDQSIERIKRQLKKTLDTDGYTNSCVYMAHSKDLEILQQDIKNFKSKCLHLIIHDECQWGISSTGTIDFKILTNETLLNNKNAFILHISATAYPYDAIENLPKDQILNWNKIVPSNSEYKGLKALIQANKIIEQSDDSLLCLEKIKNNSLISYLNVSSAELAILIEYVVTLHCILLEKTYSDFTKEDLPNDLRPFVTDQTKEILENFYSSESNGKGQLVVLRMQKRRTAKILKKWMKAILKEFNQMELFDVVLDCIDDLNNQNQNLFDALSKSSKLKLKNWDQKKFKKKLIYDDLKGLPMLLILIEKGRCGDTFPSNFKYFDLRPRYQSKNSQDTTYYASLKQDVGRAFGYGERPKVFLAKKIKYMLDIDKLRPHHTLKRIRNENFIENENNPDDIYDASSKWAANYIHPFTDNDNPNLHKRRFVLKAQPQIGKTGAFLYAVDLFLKHIYKTKKETEVEEILNDPEKTKKIIELYLLEKKNKT